MPWVVVFHPSFIPEFRALDDRVKAELGVVLDALRAEGPEVGRPLVDTLNGSAHANMKEARCDVADNWYRFAFAFDPLRRAVVLCGGGKGGGSQDRFYRRLVALADERYESWLRSMT